MITTYRNTSKEAYYSPTTQRAANLLSKYMYGRQYKFSNYQQILNMLSIHIDDLDDKLKRHLINKTTSNFMLDTPDVIHTVDDDSGEKTYVANGSDTCEISEYSNINDFWLKTIPYGISESESNSDVYNYSLTEIEKEHTIGKLFTNPVRIFIHLNGTGSFINNVYGEEQYGTVVTIKGLDEFGIYRTESFTAYYSTYFKSLYKWIQLNSVEFTYWDDPSRFTCKISSYMDSDAINYIEDKTFQTTNTDNISKSVLWKWNGTTDRLTRNEFAANSISDLYAGIDDIDLVEEYKLLYYDSDTTFHEVTDITSLYPSDYDNKLYAIINDHLVCYSKLDHYPANIVAQAQTQTVDPIVKIDVKSSSGQLEIIGIYDKIHLNKKIGAYRFKIVNDSNYLVYHDAEWKNFSSDLWNKYDLPNTIGFKSPTVYYDNLDLFEEDTVVALDVMLLSGDIESDVFIVPKQVKKPLFQLPLSVSVDYIYQDNTTIYVSNNTDSYKVDFINNTYLYDNYNKKAIFANDFTTLTQNGTEVTLSPFNMYNELDSIGDELGLSRKNGEKNDSYINRLKYIVNNKPNSSHNGLVNGLSAELGFINNTALKIHTSTPMYISINAKCILCGEESLLLKDKTISDINTWLNLQPGVTSLVINNYFNDLPAESLFYFTNYINISQLRYEDKDRIMLPIYPDYKIKEMSINYDEGAGKVSTPAEVESYDGSGIKYYFNNNLIYTSSPLSYYDNLNVIACNTDFILKASPIISRSIHDHYEDDIQYNYINNNIEKAISDADKQHPSKWGF